MGALAYMKRLVSGNSDSEASTAMQKLLALKVQNKPGAVHDHIFAFKELATRLEADLSPKWTISSLKTSLLVQGTDSSERITGTIFTVYDSADHSGEENIGLDKLLSGLEKSRRGSGEEFSGERDAAAAAPQLIRAVETVAGTETGGSSIPLAACTTTSST